MKWKAPLKHYYTMERIDILLNGGIVWRSAAITLVCFACFIACAQMRGYPQVDSPPIVLDSATATDNGVFGARVESLERATCNHPSRYFEKPMLVKDFVGAKVKTIRVIHYLRQSEPAKPDEIRKLIGNVWDGSFQSAACGMLWSEGGAWSIECALEFQDGKQGLLITDGVHVALRDHEGEKWFFRLLPAGQ